MLNVSANAFFLPEYIWKELFVAVSQNIVVSIKLNGRSQREFSLIIEFDGRVLAVII